MADIQINSSTAGSQQTSSLSNPQPRQAIAIDPSGNFVVAWTDTNALDTSGAGVYVRRFDSAGNALTAETPVNITTSGDQQHVNLGMKPGSGEFVVTWTSASQDGSGNGIFARLFNADGTPNGTTEIAVNTKTQGAQEFSTVAVASDGSFIVVWTSATVIDGLGNVVSGDGAGKGIFARRFNADGTPINAQEFQVNTTTASDQQQAIVAMDGTGNFIVVWASNDGNGTGIYARRYTAAGVAGNEFQVNTFTAGNQSDPSIATDNNGNFFITWTSENQDGNGTGIFAQRLALADIATNPNGVTTVGSEFQVNPATAAGATGNQAGSSVAADSTGGFVVTWQSPGDTSGTGVFFQRYTTAGETLDNGQINTFINGNQQFSSVDIRANGDIVTAWTSGPSTPSQDGAGTGVFASVLPALPKLTLTLENDPFSENSGVAKVVATLDSAATADVTVNLSFAGTAIRDSDYSPAALFITIPAGQTQGFITLTGLNDPNAEGDESVIVNVTSAVNAAEVGVQTVTATITDDEPVPNLVINDVSIQEGDSGATSLIFTVTLSAPSAQLVTVNYSTADNTATAGSDYIAGSGTISFNSGVLTQTITLQVNGDTTIEDAETLFVNLSGATNATIADGQGIGTIDNDDFPIVSITATDASAAEPNLTGTYRITRTGSTTGNLTVNLLVDIGSTVAPSDYALSGGSVSGGPSNYTVTIPAGQAFVDVTLTPQDDTAIESNETLQLNVASGSGYGIDGTNNFAVVTIADNDAPQISITALDASAAEPGATGTYRLTRTSDTSASLAVNLTVDGSSTASASDYNLSGGAITGTFPNFTVNFLAGQSTVDITLTPVDDVDVEGAETAILNIASSANYTIDGANSTATVTITDNDVAPLPTITLGLTGSPLAEAGGVATVTATLSQVSAQDVTVNLGYSGTATGAGTDYSAANSIVITAGNLTGSTTITGVNDSLIEGNETVIVDVTSVTNATESGVQTVTAIITDDEPVPTISINDVSIAEGNAGTSNLVFTVSLSAPSGQTITVDFSTADGTATVADNDYTTLTGTLTFAPNEVSKTISIPIKGDTKFEPNETFVVNLSNVSATGAIADGSGTGTLTNDDVPPTVTLGLTGSPLSEAGGVATVTATLSEISTQDVTVNLGFSGTATGAGTDYTAANSIVITAGNLTGSTAITGMNDALIEGSETVIVDIASVTNGTESGVQTVTATIADDESPPLISINDVSIAEGNTGTSNLVFTVTLSAPTTQPVTVDFSTANGT
ncbi:MAG TPA: Calx-beta domain-containing protein, partial [Chroococcidiopsis sp.]